MTKGGYARANGFEMYYGVHGKVYDFLPEDVPAVIGGPLGAGSRQ